MDGNDDQIMETLDDTITNICNRLKIIAVDVDKVHRAKELLATMQMRQTFVKLIGHDDDDSSSDQPQDLDIQHSKYTFKPSSNSTGSKNVSEESSEEAGEDHCLLPFEEEKWHNFFSGFEILNTPVGLNSNDNRKCIELTKSGCEQEIRLYLLAGVRCFMLDLFTGTLHDNQSLIVKLREAELSFAKELGFPVVSTIFAKLTPRYQFSGYLSPLLTNGRSIELKKGYKVLLTVDRMYSNACTSHIIYVNARFLLYDIKVFDFILIGEELQLVVQEIRQDNLKCCVARSGLLYSYMPVLFPARCSKFRVSYEELEDLTFVREVGINIIVSNIVGTTEYHNDLEKIMAALQCDNLRLYARIVLNEIHGCDDDMNWVVKQYDGFLIELASPKTSAKCPQVLHLCPNAECFIQLAYNSKKPIVLDPQPINEQQLRIDPAQYFYTFYYPDKYVFKCDQALRSFYFTFLQSAIFNQIPPMVLSKMPYCDKSHTGADSIARAIITASIEANAAAIVISGVTTRMVQKIAHFRPLVPIIFVSHMRSAEDYVSLYYNVTMLPFHTMQFISHRRNTYRKIIYALAYLGKQKLVRNGDNVILVYNYKGGSTFPEKYLIYKFHKKHFAEHMALSMFREEEDQLGSQPLIID